MDREEVRRFIQDLLDKNGISLFHEDNYGSGDRYEGTNYYFVKDGVYVFVGDVEW